MATTDETSLKSPEWRSIRTTLSGGAPSIMGRMRLSSRVACSALPSSAITRPSRSSTRRYWAISAPFCPSAHPSSLQNVLQFDEAESRRVEATYRTADVVEQRRVMLETLQLAPGESVLDVGSGPGILAAEMAQAIGPMGAVHGIDPSESMLAIARRRELPPGSAPVFFVAGDAASLPFGDASFGVAVATQVYEYVPDMPAALAEAHRVLRPTGRLAVLDTDWDSIVWNSSDDERMRNVLAAWDEHLADPHLPRRLGGLLRDAGFRVTERRPIPLLNAGYHPESYSAYLIGFIRAFAPGRHGLTEADVAAWAEDLVGLGDDYFFSLNRYLFVAER